jgi:uncharacterized protein involved in exopolysaccharide biosynthesis
MQDPNTPNIPSHPQPGMEDVEISLLDLLATIFDNLWLLILGPIAAGLIALGVTTYYVTPVFTAKTTVLPPSGGADGGGVAAAILGRLGGVGGLVGGGLPSAASKHMAYLQSDLIADAMITKFDLVKRYEADFQVEARKSLRKETKIAEEKKTGLVTIEVTDEDPAVAAAMANYYVELLRQKMGEEALEQARERRRLLENQIEEATTKRYQSPQVRSAVIESLIREFEVTRLEEQQADPLIVQLDRAEAPELKSGPKRALISALTALATGLLLLLLVFVRQAIKNAGQDDESREKINRIRKRIFLKPL